MYKYQDRNTKPLFQELFPFGGKLDKENRWLKVAEIIPWKELEGVYAARHAKRGRPAKDSRLIVGLLAIKHMTGLSDEEVLESVRENPYQQAFCGFDQLVTDKILDPSTLTKQRRRLGKGFFEELEKKVYEVLIEKKVLKAKGMYVDATVFPESIKYPNDVGLLNDVREWLVKRIKGYGEKAGERIRTYCRRAKQGFLNFARKKVKQKKTIRKAQKQMLQYVRRNLEQVRGLVGKLEKRGEVIEEKVRQRLEVAGQIYEQQKTMYKEKVNRIKARIVSFARPYVRPIVRGKNGKEVEFGSKAGCVHVDGFVFLDHLEHRAFAEEEFVKKHVETYKERFGKAPPSFTADKKYGTKDNREYLEKEGIRVGFKALGRKRKDAERSSRWLKKKQRERNRIEGDFGNGKEHYGLDRVLYSIENGSEIWVRLGLLGMNLKTALRKIQLKPLGC